LRARLQISKRAIAAIGMRLYLGDPADPDSRTVYGRTNDISPSWLAVRQIIFNAASETFATHGNRPGAASGDKWEQRQNPEYLEWKDRMFPQARLMELTGRLKQQVTGQSGDHFEERTNTRLTIGSNALVGSGAGKRYGINAESSSEDVGGVQAEGEGWYFSPVTHRPIRRPRRPVFQITKRDVSQIAKAILDYVLGGRRVRLNVRRRVP